MLHHSLLVRTLIFFPLRLDRHVADTRDLHSRHRFIAFKCAQCTLRRADLLCIHVHSANGEKLCQLASKIDALELENRAAEGGSAKPQLATQRTIDELDVPDADVDHTESPIKEAVAVRTDRFQQISSSTHR
jgi:hypothetical protein